MSFAHDMKKKGGADNAGHPFITKGRRRELQSSVNGDDKKRNEKEKKVCAWKYISRK